MNLWFALKGMCAFFVLFIIVKFACIPLIQITTSTISDAAVDQGIDSNVGPILVMLDNVFTVIAIIFGLGIIAIILAIAFSGGGEQYEGNIFNRY